MQNSIKVTFIVCATVLIIALLGFFLFRNFVPNYSDTVNVNGQGVVKAVPDLITIYYNIDTQGATSKEAKDKNDVILEKLKSEFESKEISTEKLQTQSFSIYENNEWTNGKMSQNGFKATHYLKLELPAEDFDLVSDAIDAGVSAEAQISSINFELSPGKEAEFKAQAIKMASDDAQKKANALAEGFGKKVGKLVSVSVDEYYYQPYNLYSNGGGAIMVEADVAKDATANLNPSEQDVTARVSAVFRLR